MLVALNIIAAEKSNSTEATAKAVTHLLNYAAPHSEAITRYHSSGMIIHIHSDASFLSEPVEKSISVRYHYLVTASVDPKQSPPNQPPLNGPVNVECTTMKNVLASAMEAELGALFVNCQRDEVMCIALIEMGHAQPPTPAVTDSATGDGFVNDNIHQRRSRAIDMHFTGSETESDKDDFWCIRWLYSTI